MAAYIGNDLGIVEPCTKCNDYSTILQFSEPPRNTRLFKIFNEAQCKALQSAPISFNYHSFMVDYHKFTQNQNLHRFFRVLSTSPSKDNSFTFVSAIEGREFPLYGLQHHPEWCFHDFYFPKVNVVCSEQTKGIGKAIGKFFLEEAGKNKHKYEDKNELRQRTIINAKIHLDSSKGYIYLLNKVVNVARKIL